MHPHITKLFGEGKIAIPASKLQDTGRYGTFEASDMKSVSSLKDGSLAQASIFTTETTCVEGTISPQAKAV